MNIQITSIGFLDWWNAQSYATQQDWFTRHTAENDADNHALALAHAKTKRQRDAR